MNGGDSVAEAAEAGVIAGIMLEVGVGVLVEEEGDRAS